MTHTQFSWSASAGAAALALALALGGCAPPAPEEAHPFWPPPPAAPRVVHLKNIQGPGDLVPPTFLDNLAEFITGEKGVSLVRPHAVAVWEDKYLYVTDQERQAVVVFDLKSPKANLIAQAGEQFFISPVGVAACGDTFAVSDSALNAVFLMTPQGKLRLTLARPGGFKRPTGLAYDALRSRLYVADTLANEICIYDLPSGKLVGTFGTHGTAPGQFNYPTHICLDQVGRVFVTDSMNFRVQAFDAQGKYLFHIGRIGDATGHMAVPKGVGVDRLGHIYVVDSYFSTIQAFDERGTFLLAIGQPGKDSGDFQVPAGLAVDSKNRIYVCDSYNSRIQLFQYVGGPTRDPNTTTQP